jgi:hypothetical protein
MKRRQAFVNACGLGGLSAVGGLSIRSAFADVPSFLYHDPRGNKLLKDTLDNPTFWTGAEENTYSDSPYDTIRIQQNNGAIVTFITGTGKTAFDPSIVADCIFQYQDIIPTYMSRLKVGEYLGRGIDPYNAEPYSDMFFLADIKIFYMSVPLRTGLISLGDGRYVCPIELVTEAMVEPLKWTEYTKFMKEKADTLQGGWTIFPVVPMEYLVGYYLVEPDKEFGARVSMVTRMQFKREVSWVADWGSELPIVLRQGMIAGFMGSVHACQHRMKELVK